MKIGDIVLIPFPFAETTNKKVRPAVVIAETADKYKDVVVSAISSVVPEILSEREMVLESTQINMLRVKSVLKADRIVTLKREDKIADLGELSESELTKYKLILSQMIK